MKKKHHEEFPYIVLAYSYDYLVNHKNKRKPLYNSTLINLAILSSSLQTLFSSNVRIKDIAEFL